MRGNVVDLAVAVVIGAAFTTIVNSVVNGVINPVVGALGTSDLSSYRSCIKSCARNSAGHIAHGVYIQWGAVLGAALNFVITGGVVYFLMVLPMSRYLARRAARLHKEAIEEVPQETEVELLREIRDELLRRRDTAS